MEARIILAVLLIFLAKGGSLASDLATVRSDGERAELRRQREPDGARAVKALGGEGG